jgi:hypothetical protein
MSVIRHPSTGTAVTVKQWRYTATGGETTLSGTDGFGLSLSYTVGAEEVYINGVLLERAVDYTASTGTSITGLTALVAGDIATVMSANSFNVANAIPNSTVGAKGDLIVANGAASVTNLAVGADGTTLVANSSSATGVAWAGPASANPVLNSAFQIWQRGTSVAIAASNTATYAADRWSINTNANQAFTFSRQTTNDTTNLPFIQYCARVQRNSGQTGTSTMAVATSFETINSIPFAGKTVTMSFYARAGANYSATSNALAVYLQTGTGTDQNVLSGFTGQAQPISQTATLTTTWQRFSYSATLATSITQLAPTFGFTPTGTAGTNDYFEVTGMQVDIGSVALPFRTYAGTVQGELAACQRYFVRKSATAGTDAPIGTGVNNTSTSLAGVPITMPVTMRTAPSFSLTGSPRAYDGSTAPTASVATYGATVDGVSVSFTSSGLIAGRPGVILAPSAGTANYDFSAEL